MRIWVNFNLLSIKTTKISKVRLKETFHGIPIRQQDVECEGIPPTKTINNRNIR